MMKLYLFLIIIYVNENSAKIYSGYNTTKETVVRGRQPRTIFGPLLELLFSSLLNQNNAKYQHSSVLEVPYDSSPWLPYNKPQYNYHEDHHHQSSSDNWYPLLSPYYSSTPTLTTYGYNLPPENVYNHGISDILEESQRFSTNIESPPDFDEEMSSSNVDLRRNHPKYKNNRRRIETMKHKQNKNNVKEKRRHTTEYYDDYVDIIRPIKRKSKPTTKKYLKRRRTTTASYDDYYDSFERTTKFYGKNKKRRRPIKIKNKRRGQNSEESLQEYDYYNNYDQSEEYSTENDDDFVFARQESTTEPTTTTTTTRTTTTTTTTPRSTTTTTNPSSTTIETTTANNSMNASTGYGPRNNNENISITYGPVENPNNYDYQYSTFTGYGPSNGNENISITYGPPTGSRFDYPSQNVDWYSHFTTKNAVVKMIQDIVNYDNDFYSRSDTKKTVIYNEQK